MLKLPIPCRTLAALVLLAAAPSPGRAQPSAGGDTLGCGARAALFVGEQGFRAWVVRSGAMERGDPLRPLDSVTQRVLEARIGARTATAYGPDYDNLRRGLAPAELQAVSGGAPIRWEAGIDRVPRALRIVGEDGAPLAALRFESCGDAPRAASAVARAAAKPRVKPAAKPDAGAAPPGLTLPQGAIP